MRNIVKSLFIVLSCLMATTVSAQTVVTWTPTQADVTALTNTSIHYVDVGSGTKSFKIYSIRPFLNNNQVKLEWDGSVNAVKMTDNGMEKAGLAIYVPTTSDNISKIVVYMHTTGSRKTYYTSGNPCPTSNPSTYTTSALATSSTGYEFWTGTLSKDMYYACGGRKDGSGESYFDKIEVTFAGLPPASSDATLSALTYDGGTSVPSFSPSKISYDVELPANYVGVPSIQGTPNHANATISDLTQATSIPGTASITVTAEDGTTTLTYTVTFTRESAEPKVESATWANIRGTAVIDQVNKTITGQVTNGSSLMLTPQFTGKNIDHWTPDDAQDFSTGNKNYIFFSSTSESSTYTVTITEAPAMSSDATLKSLTYGGTSVPNFSPNTLRYDIQLTAGIKTPPTIAATANDTKANVQVNQAQSVPGTGTVVVTAEDGTQLTYTVNYTVPVPVSGLALHVPEVYEGRMKDGGYGTPLVEYNEYFYEIYYTGKTKNESGSSVGGFATQLGADGKIANIIGMAGATTSADWFEGQCNSPDESTSASSIKQFPGYGGSWKIYGNEIKIHISGYDQFSVLAKDKKSKLSDGRYIQIKIDGADVTKESELNTGVTARDYTISTGEHVIEIIGTGSEASQVYAFSLRLPKEPKTKHFKGNDSTQVLLQTTTMRSVVYTTKYNNLPTAETRLEWLNTPANGITLSEKEGGMVDTLTLSGTANCPVGTYPYAVVAYYNGAEINRVTGTFKVISEIYSTSDINVTVYQNEEMDQITFKYYALSADDVTLRWTNGNPGGTVQGSGSNGTYVIGGVPANVGIYPYEISVLGADTVIKGQIKVKELDYGTNPVLYLQRTDNACDDDAVYKYLESTGKWSMIARRQKADGLRGADQYQRYKWIIISEDVDANNPEVIQIIRGGANLPVLNLKGYTYATDGLDDETRLGWGDPNSGAIDSTAQKVNGCKIKIEQPTHPVFAKMSGATKDAEIAILDGYANNGIMPIRVYKQGTLCLATGYTRSLEDYYSLGELQTAIHEVPADMRGGKKYICLPIARTASLNTQGKRLIDGIVDYLTSGTASPVQIPSTQIMQFTVAGINADIDHAGHSIVLKMTVEDYVANDSLRAAKPKITLADPANTHVTPDSEEEVDLRFTAVGLTKKYTVSDYINQWTYNFSIKLYTPQGIEEAYESGMWVNIYDIYGRKVATTNEDIYSMDLPHGMYIVVTENGSTLKIMR